MKLPKIICRVYTKGVARPISCIFVHGIYRQCVMHLSTRSPWHYLDHQFVLCRTSLQSEASCQRAVLELCALKMSCATRKSLVVGARKKDELHYMLRGRLYAYHPVLLFNRQRYFAKDEIGQQQVLDSLFTVIRGNPQALLRVLME